MNATIKATVCANLMDDLDVQADQTVSKTLYQDKQIKVVIFGFAAGQELSEHSASFPAILQFLSGEATVTLGDETIEARGGTFTHMPPHLPHSIAAKVETRMLLVMLKEAKQ